MISLVPFSREVGSWSRFERVRAEGHGLLAMLDHFPQAVLVAGCQRSGTTALAEMLISSREMVDYRGGGDSELEGALLLCGRRAAPAPGRYCFQTTYLNDCYGEYFEHDDYRLVWVVREPFSVIYSMLHNWRRGALNRLFRSCGQMELGGAERGRFERFGLVGVSRITRAVCSYRSKVGQLFTLLPLKNQERLLVVDYDALLLDRARWVRRICDFAKVRWEPRFETMLSRRSPDRRRKFNRAERRLIEERCMALYQGARSLAIQ